MKQVTLISMYGHKPEALSDLIHGCTEIIQGSPLRRVFRPYHPNQIHGTIVGMEKLVGYKDQFNANIWLDKGNKTAMNFAPLGATLQSHLPMMIQFGGFPPEFNGFDSLGRRPYERSFQVQWKTNRFTMIGWPHNDSQFSPRFLNQLRDDLDSKCGIKHKWGADNDLFMVLGEIANLELFSDSELTDLKHIASGVETEVRDYLVSHTVDVDVGMDEIFIAQYETETLSLSSTLPYRFTHPSVTPKFISDLYT